MDSRCSRANSAAIRPSLCTTPGRACERICSRRSSTLTLYPRTTWWNPLRRGRASGPRRGTVGPWSSTASNAPDVPRVCARAARTSSPATAAVANAAQPKLRLQVKYDEGWFGAHFPRGVDGLHFQVHDIIKHVLGSLTLHGAPHVNVETLKLAGFTEDELEKIEQSLPGTFEISFAFSPWSLGAEAMKRFDEAALMSKNLEAPQPAQRPPPQNDC